MGGLQGGLHADDGQGHFRPQGGRRYAGGGVAGNDHRFHVSVEQLSHDLPHPGHDGLRGLGAIGSIGGVTVIDHVLLRQLCPQFPQYADAAHAAVKNAHGTLPQGVHACFHVIPRFLFAVYKIRKFLISYDMVRAPARSPRPFRTRRSGRVRAHRFPALRAGKIRGCRCCP